MGRRRKLLAGGLAAMLAVGAMLTGGAAQGQGAAPTSVELILDASGSMFSRLPDGSTRIVAAKAVLSDFISRLPDTPGLNVGLRVYGANVAANGPDACKDSQLVLPLKGVDRPALLGTVARTRPHGATPIAYSLGLAAADFPQDAGRNLIVLVTDGQESCRGDLKGALAGFKARGIEVDLRIVGIDLDASAVRSFAGIGTLENARSGAELASALGRAVGTVAQPSVQSVPVTVTLTSGGKPVASGPSVSFGPALGGGATTLGSSSGTYSASLMPGGYTARVTSGTGGTQSFGGLSVTPGGPNRFAFEIGAVTPVALDLTPRPPVAGSTVKVTYSGAPAGENNWVAVALKAAPDSEYLDTQTARGASGAAQLNLPGDASEYELRYYLSNPDGSSRVIGRSNPFTPQHVAASVSGPASAVAGSQITVKWTGPSNPSDYVTVVKQGAPEGSYLDYKYTRDGNPLTLSVPLEAGDYELRYSSDASARTLASAPITLKPGSYSLTAPATATSGSTLAVNWSGPNNSGEYVTVVQKGAPIGTYTTYFYTRDGNPGKLKLPTEPGEYELRYSAEGSSPNPTLYSLPLTIAAPSGAAAYSLQAPASVTGGAQIQVKWSGPNNSGDYVTVVKAGDPVGTYTQYFYTKGGNPGTLKMPFAPGDYELRYSTEGQQPNPTLYSLNVKVVAASYSLTAPRTARAGSSSQIKWSGPNNPGEYVTVVKKGADVGSYTSYFYTRDGNPGTLPLPAEPGEYELRYSTEAVSPNPTLFTLPLTIVK